MRFLRRLVPIVAGLGLVASTFAGCEWPEGTRFVDRVYTETQIEVHRNILYRETTDYLGQPKQLYLDIYEPRRPEDGEQPSDQAPETRSERPVMMWMFGGAWVLGNRGTMANHSMDSARRGYVAINIDYRIRTIGADIIAAAWDAYDDVVAAVQWIKDHAAEYGIDADAIVAGGISAGGINAMHLLYAPGQRPTGPTESPIAGGVAISGLSFIGPQGIDPPSIMHQGTADPITPYATARTTCDEAVANGSECNWFGYEGGTHGLAGQAAQVQDDTALMIFERILWPQGYRPEFPNED
jgi:acetyl esterase/lipase